MLSPGERVGEYIVEAELGEGGMARVYRARHTILDTLHAVKVLEPKYRADPETRKRFLAEAKIQAKHLGHENIVKVTNIVATSEHAALVMELIEGPDLESLAGKLKDPEEIKQIFVGILAGVGSAHAEKIIHRDLKPANVLLARKPDGSWLPKVTDFGVAKVVDDPEKKRKKKSTHPDARMGTLHYMSPEQIRRAKDVTVRSDIFSLGAMLYELVTGDVPFDGQSDYDIMEQIVKGKYARPSGRVKGLDPVLDSVICTALSPDPAQRYGSCEEMAAALRGAAQPASGSASATGGAPAGASAPPHRNSRPTAAVGAPGRTRAGGIAIVGAGLALAAGAVAFYVSRDNGHAKSASHAAARPVEEAPAPRAAPSSPATAPSDPDELPPLATFDPGTGQLTPTPDHEATSVADGIEPHSVRVIQGSALATDAAPGPKLAALSKSGSSGSTALIDELLIPQEPTTGDPAERPLISPSKPILRRTPAPAPCSGSYKTADGLAVRVTGTRENCGTYGFSERTGDLVRSCTGSLTGCRLKNGVITARFSCSYNRGVSQHFGGSMTLSCKGKTMSAKVTSGGHSRNWVLFR